MWCFALDSLEAIEALDNKLHEQEIRASTIISTNTNNGNVSIPRSNQNATQSESNCQPSQTIRSLTFHYIPKNMHCPTCS